MESDTRGLASAQQLAMVLALACVCGRRGFAQESDLVAKPIFEGSLDAALAGLELSEEPRAFFYGGPARTSREFLKVHLLDTEAVTASRNWRRAVHSGFDGKQTSLHLGGDAPLPLPGRARFSLDSVGLTTVAWWALDDEASWSHVRILERGEMKWEADFERLQWTDVSGDGQRVAFGTRAGTLVFDRSGAQSNGLPPAERGILSAKGAWLALDSGAGAEHRFTLTRLEPELTSSFLAYGQAVSLAFDAKDRRIARVSPGLLQVFRLEAGGAQLEFERMAPDGFVWRSAALDDGERLAAGRIRVERRTKRERPAKGEPRETEKESPGTAWIAVDLFAADAAQPEHHALWEAELWNSRSPELSFGASGRLFCIVWPSAFELAQP